MALLTFRVEIDRTPPEPPAPEPPQKPLPGIKPIKQTFQAHKGVSAPCTAWVRGIEGKSDLSGLVMTVEVRSYGRHHVRAVWEAESPEVGRVDFTVPHDHKLEPGLYRLDIRATGGAGSVLAQGALLEIV